MEAVTRIFDIYLVAYLLCRGYAEVSPARREGRFVYFYFPQSPELEQETLGYYTGNSTFVNAQDFSTHVKKLRVIMTTLQSRRGVADNGRT